MSIEGQHHYRFTYLKSEQWQTVRVEALAREKAKCQICGEESISNDAHHIWYPESIWETTHNHLVILCRPCHDFIHTMIPECKTNDETEGRAHWNKFRNAIAMWRRDRAVLFTGYEWLLDKSPRELRAELNKLQLALAKVQGSPESTNFKRSKPFVSDSEVVFNTLKKWLRAYEQSAPCVNSVVADSDYQI